MMLTFAEAATVSFPLRSLLKGSARRLQKSTCELQPTFLVSPTDMDPTEHIMVMQGFYHQQYLVCGSTRFCKLLSEDSADPDLEKAYRVRGGSRLPNKMD